MKTLDDNGERQLYRPIIGTGGAVGATGTSAVGCSMLRGIAGTQWIWENKICNQSNNQNKLQSNYNQYKA